MNEIADYFKTILSEFKEKGKRELTNEEKINIAKFAGIVPEQLFDVVWTGESFKVMAAEIDLVPKGKIITDIYKYN